MGDQSDAIRADIRETGEKYVRSGSITINAPASVIFDIVANPQMHHRFDGSGTVTGSATGPDRLSLGAKFGMGMKIKVPYRIQNTVVEFDVNRRIGWRHAGHHIWRYEFEPIDDTTTLVTETFDGSTARFPPALNLMNAYENNQKAILKTLTRLKVLAEESTSAEK
jgi:hypothetical protein